MIWSAADPIGPWTRQSSGVTTDLLAIAGWNGSVVVGGAAGTLLFREDGWSVRESGVSVDLIDFWDGFLLGADGRVFEIEGDADKLHRLDKFGGGRAITSGLVVVGDDGKAYLKIGEECEVWH